MQIATSPIAIHYKGFISIRICTYNLSLPISKKSIFLDLLLIFIHYQRSHSSVGSMNEKNWIEIGNETITRNIDFIHRNARAFLLVNERLLAARCQIGNLSWDTPMAYICQQRKEVTTMLKVKVWKCWKTHIKIGPMLHSILRISPNSLTCGIKPNANNTI